MRLGIDSGAAVTVIGRHVAPYYPALAGLKRTLMAASGAAIPEYGCKRLVVGGAWGQGIVKAAAAGVSKNLCRSTSWWMPGTRSSFGRAARLFGTRGQGDA